MDSLALSIASLGLTHVQVFIAAFVLTFLIGEPVVLSLAFLSAANGLMSIWEIVVIGYATAILGEMFWFYVSRSRWANLLGDKYAQSVTGEDFKRYIGKMERGNPLRLLFLVRFITGISVLVVIYLSRRGLSARKFLLYCLLVNAFWTPFVTLLGFGAGRGYTLLLSAFENIRMAIEIGFGLLILAYIAYRIFRKKPWAQK